MSVSWSTGSIDPIDCQLLERYGVKMEEIQSSLATLIKELSCIEREALRNWRHKTPIEKVRCKIFNQFKVEIDFLWPEEQVRYTCDRCSRPEQQVILLMERCYGITNKKNQSSVCVSNVAWHFISQHGELGNRDERHVVSPTQLCRVLQLGNTKIADEDPLLQASLLRKWGRERMQQKRADEQTLKAIGCTAKQIGQKLDLLIKNRTDEQEVFTIDEKIQVVTDDCFESASCSLCDPEWKRFGTVCGTIKNLANNIEIKIHTLALHGILQHGYFGDANSQLRINPKQAAKVLELIPEKSSVDFI